MAGMQILDVRNPGQVASVSKIEAKLPDGRTFLVLSGIAITGWEVDSNEVNHGETDVHLGVYGTKMDQWTAFVGLAAIGNLGEETGFVIAVDTARVWLVPETGELVLTFHPVLMGEPAAIYRVSYQVVVTLVTVTPQITGTITWPRTYLTPPNDDVANIADEFEIFANHYERIDPPDEFSYDKLTPVMHGRVVKLTVGPNSCVAHYRIENPPLATELKVTVKIGPKFSVPPPARLNVGQVAGPDVFTLTGGAPSIDGIDFAIGELAVR